MAVRRKDKGIPEIPLTSTADVAFLLLIFFLVAASNAVDRGAPLDLPSTTKQQNKAESKNIDVGVKPVQTVIKGMQVTYTVFTVNGEPISVEEGQQPEDALFKLLKEKLEGVTDPKLRMVTLTADRNLEWQVWTSVQGAIEKAGGIAVPQLEEEETNVQGAVPAEVSE